MTVEETRITLEKEGQAHLLRFWDRLDATEQQELLQQIAGLDFKQIRRMRELLRDASSNAPKPTESPLPAEVATLRGAERLKATACGEEALRQGRVGVLLVAGGQGSRLGFDGPKGAFPIGPISNEVLFYFHARKVLALSRAMETRIPLYIMTSQGNDRATRDCFEEHEWFGLAPENVIFFRQGMWPALDPAGRIMLADPAHLFMSPDGHGGTLSALVKSGALKDMQRRGLTTLFYFQVDNPLVEVADPAFVGLHLIRGADLSLKVCAKRDPDEGLGVVVRRPDGRWAMVEYSELSFEQKQRRGTDGELFYKYGSVAIHVFDLKFLEREALRDMPLHLAHKKIDTCDNSGHPLSPDAPNGYKFEKFIFDLLPQADNVINLSFERREEFSPVKNAQGMDSPFTCRRDLMAKWVRWLDACEIQWPVDAKGLAHPPVEIDPGFANSAAQLCQRLRREPPPDITKPLWLKA